MANKLKIKHRCLNSDSERTRTTNYFDRRAANRAVKFFEVCLVHTKGEWAGKPFILRPWERKIVRDIFGWKRADGTRQYRTLYLEIPRKNGKSTFGAGIALYLLYADGEPGAEIYSAATDREQASIIFEMAKDMVKASPLLAERAEIYRRAIVLPDTLSTYKVLSADVPSKHGFNAHGIIFDELHAQPNRELWDTLTTSVGARRQPLIVAITTAGYDKSSICWQIHDYATKVSEGIIKDESFYAVIFSAGKEDDWRDPEVWAKANPNLGIVISKTHLAQEFKKAEEMPAYQNTFRRLHLNQWTEQSERWLDVSKWSECAGKVDLESLRGRECYGGLDLASSIDIAAFVLVFPEDSEGGKRYRLIPFFWVPRENARKRADRDRVPYDVWLREGHIMGTEGNVIDYAFIRAKILELSKIYEIREIAFDRWGATQISVELQEEGFRVIQFGQGFASMSPATKELMNLILSKKIIHNNNPVMNWMASNMAVKQDPAGNIKPDKSKSSEKIDGMVALIMALDRAIRHEGGRSTSIYNERGILTI